MGERRVMSFNFRLKPNPVMLKELRSQMRGWRAFVVLTVYLLLLSCLTLALYLSVYATSAAMVSLGGGLMGATTGRTLFGGIVLLELLLVCFIAPAFTAGTISGERERQTYDLLVTTLLRPRSIVFGKLGSALAYVVLLILAALPLQSLAFILGGVTPAEVFIALIGLLVTALISASVGLFFSSLVRSTILSTVLTYGVVLFMTVGLPFVIFMVLVLTPVMASLSNYTPTWVEQALLIYVLGFLACTNPFITAVLTELVLLEEGAVLFFTVPVDGHNIPLVSPWIVYVLLCLLVGVALFALSVQLVCAPRG
ncbi:MAG: ABC transporter permease [Anaerolineae bacterium]|nr:ABC transporter permease [Anaerolineae bacterium]